MEVNILLIIWYIIISWSFVVPMLYYLLEESEKLEDLTIKDWLFIILYLIVSPLIVTSAIGFLIFVAFKIYVLDEL